MQNTEYLGLKKPESTDFYNVNDFNENFDTIDNRFKNLSNVDNTADFEKPMSNPQKVYVENLKDQLEKDIQDVARVTELALNKATTHLSDKNNPHGVTKAQVGLDKVNNTADMDKPVSTATKKALEEVESNGKITSTATGEHITVDNSADAPVRSLKVDGKTEQFTTTGVQLFNKEVVYNGYYINGNNGNVESFESTCVTEYIEIDSSKNYLYIASNPNYQWGAFYDMNKNYVSSASVSNLGNKIKIPQNAKYIRYTIPNENIDNFQISYGETELPYEPYTNGASPNPDYPQDIKGVGDSGEVEVTVTGKNIFGGDALADKLAEIAKATKNENDGTVTWAAWGSHKQPLYEDFKENTQYTIILKVSSDTTTINMCFEYTDGTYANFVHDSNGNVVFTTKAGKTIQSLMTFWYDSTTKIYYNECGVFEGVVTLEEFEEYKSQTVKIPSYSMLSEFPLYEGDSVTLKNGKLEYIRKTEMVVFDGSEGFISMPDGDTEESFLVCFVTPFGSGIANRKLWCDKFSTIADAQNNNKPNTCSFNPLAIYSNVIYFNVPYDLVSITKTATETEKANALKAWLSQNPITVVYELAEPITETMATDIDLSTYNHVTYITNADNANMEVEYFTNSANGEVIVDLQEEIKRLDNEKANKTEISRLDREKANISLLKDYVKKIQRQINKISVPAHTSIDYDYLIDEYDYTPILANVSVINTTDSNPVVCLKSCFDVSLTHAEFQLHNMSDSICDVDVLLEVLYVKDI